ncbi:heptaprenyl diphosphate synthase component I [Magnetococcus marinus MC-1]|uniref:Heptaprenyl diphosphate synthase component I n=1 Tax=Magnetococcus marinus (strain ATCC BAA-1437 / JCM 17883 / MC-1) TaxID=156889 RepID=A0L469_MAGMM|nr:Gx transporter family protein [Magnetococcus marinus]ABK42762.1 heptaprenyl diphosphate synthase component I [Magnetococcus marinus MC-1]
MKTSLTPLRRDLLIGYLAVAAVAAHMLEATLPGLGPWFKPGLANVFTVVAFFYLDREAAIWVALIRVLGGSLAMGAFLTPSFFLSGAGMLGAIVVMLLPPLPGMGAVGLSILMALAHMCAQVAAAHLLFVQHSGLFYLLPWFLLGAWCTGWFNGVLAHGLLHTLRQHKV